MTFINYHVCKSVLKISLQNSPKSGGADYIDNLSSIIWWGEAAALLLPRQRTCGPHGAHQLYYARNSAYTTLLEQQVFVLYNCQDIHNILCLGAIRPRQHGRTSIEPPEARAYPKFWNSITKIFVISRVTKNSVSTIQFYRVFLKIYER